MEKAKQERVESHAKVQSVNTKLLFQIGDEIARRYNYKKLCGIEAVHYYLIQKYHWLPSQVKALNSEDLLFCLEEDDFSSLFDDSDLS